MQIAEAKNPGYFSYYKSPRHIVEQEHSGELQARIASVTAMEADMLAARADLEEARESARQAKLDKVRAPETASSSLAAWFDVSCASTACSSWCAHARAPVPRCLSLQTYGRPSTDAGGAGYRTTFKSSTKLHGGTKHYAAFKSSATSMQVGRMLK